MLAYLGCTPVEFCDHLESQFISGMSWDNMHLWHIDHISPLYTFDPTSETDNAEAWHYTNMRPLWIQDNLRRRRA